MWIESHGGVVTAWVDHGRHWMNLFEIYAIAVSLLVDVQAEGRMSRLTDHR